MRRKREQRKLLLLAALFLTLFFAIFGYAETLEEDPSATVTEEMLTQLDMSASVQSVSGESAVFGIAVMNKQKDIELSWQGNYTYVLANGSYKNQRPSLVSAYPAGTADAQVMEAWRVQNLKKNTDLSLSVRLDALPALGEGESLAFYTLQNGTLTDSPIMEDLAVGDLATIQLRVKENDGIALVRLAANPADLPVEGKFIWANEDIYLTGKMPGNAVVDATPVTVEVDGEIVLAAYDVKIYTNEKQRQKGKTWQPSDKKVQVHFFDEAFRDGQEMGIYHLAEGASQPEKVATVTSEDNWITFEAESFSTYAVTVHEKIVEAGNGETYQITVSYDAKSGIPADAQVQAEEIDIKSEEYRDYLDRTAKTLNKDLSSVVYSRLFDISLVGPDGTEYQPNDEVSVSIQLMENAAQDVEQVRVVHFADEAAALQPAMLNAKSLNGGMRVQSAQSSAGITGGNELSATTHGTTVSFGTNGFSVFALVDFTTKEEIFSAGFDEHQARKLYEDDNITLSGSLPPHGIVEARPVQVQVEDADVLIAYDIKIYANSDMKDAGISWQPSAGELTVQVNSDILEDGKTFNIYHMEDENSKPEFVTTAEAMDHAVTFNASSFSIYPIGEDPENARIGYRFWYYNGATEQYEEINTQYFRHKDVHEYNTRIYEPSIPGISQEEFVQIFEGWHKGTVSGSSAELETETVTIKGLNDELIAKADTDFVEGTIIDVIAKLKPAYYITYVDVNSSSILSTDLVLKEETGTTYFQVKENVKPTKYENKLTGWVRIEDLTEEEPDLYEPGYSYEITSNMTLAPMVEGGYWLVFDDNDLIDNGTGKMVSGGASYTAPAFYMNSTDEKQSTVKPDDPTWTGYAFGGWYEDAACTTPFEFGQLLTKNITVHAKWIPSASSYRVIIWKQKATDKVDAANDAKTYDYDFSEVISTDVKTGDLVYLNSSYTTIYGENGTSTDTDKQYFTYNQEKSDAYIVVKADGSSAMNVYYDREPMTINFYTWGTGYVYTETTADTGTQYGIYNGGYVELTHLDGDDIYSYSYSPVYTATTGNNGTQYGIIDGEYKELDREAVYQYTYRPFNITTGTTGTQYALIDGEYVELTRNVTYYPVDGYSYTQSTNDNDNNPQKYGIINGNIVEINYSSGFLGIGAGWYYGNSRYYGSRFTRGNADASNTPYTGTVYYVGTENTQNFTNSGTGTAYGRSGNNNNFTYFPLRGEVSWTYVRDGQTITHTGTRFMQSGTGSDYTGTRYTRAGSNWWSYNYTETDANGTGLYGLDERNGHVSLTRATSGSYIYSYNGNQYTGTRYTSNNNPATYTGRRYTNDDGVYHITDENGGGLYGQDDNGVFRPLTASVTKAKVWAYVDNEGEIHYYNGTRYTRSANQYNSWQLYKQFMGLYGSTLESNGYSWPMEYNWYEIGYGRGGNANTNSNYNNANTGGSRMTIKTTFEPVDGELSKNYYGNTPTTSGVSIRFWKEKLDQTGYDQADEIFLGSNSGTFHINDKYTGFHAAYYSTNGGNTRTAVTPKGSDGYYGSAVSYQSNGLDIYFDRTNYKLSFFTNNAGNDVVEYSIPYESEISKYSAQTPGQKTGYYFLGWYEDAACTKPFDFSITMPDHNVDVYGYWRMERIRVVIVPGAGNAYIGSQALRFRLDYDETIGGALLESATRVGYVLDGWYTDPDFTNKWIFSNPVNSSVEGVDMTYQTAAKWASARVIYGDDDEEHSNVRGILQLYAKWIPDTSEKGVNILYDAGDAGIYDSNGTLITVVPIDPRLYQDGSDVVVGAPPTGYSELYIFDYWEVVDSEGNVLTVTDSHGNETAVLYPGISFNVSGVEPYSTLEVEGETILKTIKLRAKYTKSEEAAARFTTITYDGDKFIDSMYPEGTTERQGRAKDGSERMIVTLDKQINTEIVLPDVEDFFLDGFELVGWSFFPGTYNEQVAALQQYNNAPENADNQLTDFKPNQIVAADNIDQGSINTVKNTLYAMWQPKTYSITVKQVVEAGVPVTTYNYPYRYGVENKLDSEPLESDTLSLSGNSDKTWEDAVEYYGRVGHVFNITSPTISEEADYAVRVNATVLMDDGSRKVITPNEKGNYEVLGDIEITYTYAMKVPVKIEKRSLSDQSELTGSSFVLTPVEWNAETQHWDVIGTSTFAFDMTEVSTLTKRLQEGIYRVEETKAPTDYAMMGEPLMLTVRKDEAFLIRTTTGDAVKDTVAKLSGQDSHTLTIYDRPIREITIKKVVQGQNTETAGYTFSVQLTLEESPMRNYDTVGDGISADTTNSAGIIEFRLGDGETKTLRIPWDAVIRVAENEYVQFVVEPASQEGVADTETENDRIYSCKVDKDDTITFTNKNTLLAVSKKVTGDFGDVTMPFDFTLTGLTAGKLYRLNVAENTITRTANDEGAITFQLKHGQRMEIGLIDGIYTIEEDPEEYYVTSIAVNGGTAEKAMAKEITLSEEAGNAEVEFTNHYPTISPTGVSLRVAPYLLMLVMGLALMTAMRYGRKQKN